MWTGLRCRLGLGASGGGAGARLPGGGPLAPAGRRAAARVGGRGSCGCPLLGAIESQNLELLGQTLGVRDGEQRALLASALPMLTGWRQQNRERDLITAGRTGASGARCWAGPGR